MDHRSVTKRHIQHEAVDQETVFQWAALMRPRYPELYLLYHIPNGGSRNALEAANLKRQGVKAGVPDLCLPVARGKYHGLYIELKKEGTRLKKKDGTWASEHIAEQAEMLEILEFRGYKAVFCVGFDEAKKVIDDYLGRAGIL